VTDGGGMRLMDRVELDEWLGRARRTWSPIKVAGRQFDAIVRDDGDVPGVAAYDHLYDAANLAVAWLDDNPCPDESVATRFRAQMMAYRAIADTVRSTIADEDGDRMVEQLGHLCVVVDQHAAAIDELAVPGSWHEPEDGREGPLVEHYRRRVPRQPAGWDGTCHIEGESSARWRECQVTDISMHGLGITLDHPAPDQLVHRRVAVDVPAVGAPVNIRLEGEVRNAVRTPGGGVRVGVEFDGLAPPDAQHLTGGT